MIILSYLLDCGRSSSSFFSTLFKFFPFAFLCSAFLIVIIAIHHNIFLIFLVAFIVFLIIIILHNFIVIFDFLLLAYFKDLHCVVIWTSHAPLILNVILLRSTTRLNSFANTAHALDNLILSDLRLLLFIKSSHLQLKLV